MPSINPYLNFSGKAEEAFNFYKSVFGGEFVGGIHRFKEMPGGDKLPANEKEMVMHVSLQIGNGNMIMGSDVSESMGHKVVTGNSTYLSISPESREEADRLFYALSAGGKIEMPIADAFWGDYFGSFQDKFGIHWMINYSKQG